MPLKQRSSEEIASANIAELIRAGHPRDQAAAIAYREAGKDAASGKLNERERAEAGKAHGAREDMPAHVFLEGEARKYPVKTKVDGEWKYDRDLLLAAAREARIHGHEDLAARADAIRKKEFGGDGEDEWSPQARKAAAEARKRNAEHEATHAENRAALSKGPSFSDYSKQHFGPKWEVSRNPREGTRKVTPKELEALKEKFKSEHPEQHKALFGDGGAAHDAYALDRASVRTYDKDGYLHVASSTISSAQINPYLGREIMSVEPGLSLDPERRYMMLRDPAALEAAAPSMHGKPLLFVHKGVTADRYDKEPVVGAVMNPRWEAPDIKAELVVWPGEASRAIESEEKRDLSAGYRYRPIMEPGTYNGVAYDGRMVDIDFNHVALVPDGRVDGALVADAQIEGSNMAKVMEALRPEVAARLKEKLAADATLADVSKLLAGDEGLVTAPNTGVPMMGKRASADKFLKDKMSAEDWKAYDAMVKAADAEEEEERKKADDAKRVKDEAEVEAEERKKEEDRKAKDRRAKDRKAKDEGEESEEEKKAREDKEAEDKRAKDAEAAQKGMEQLMSSGGAMDQRIQAALKANDAKHAEIREAERAVLPKVGSLAMAFDSAENVYRTALSILGEDKAEIADLPLPALKAIFKRIPAPGLAPRTMAFDAGGESDLAKMFPDAKAPLRV